MRCQVCGRPIRTKLCNIQNCWQHHETVKPISPLASSCTLIGMTSMTLQRQNWWLKVVRFDRTNGYGTQKMQPGSIQILYPPILQVQVSEMHPSATRSIICNGYVGYADDNLYGYKSTILQVLIPGKAEALGSLSCHWDQLYDFSEGPKEIN